MRLLLLFLLYNCIVFTSASVQPIFGCWFLTYDKKNDNTPLTNIVLGYSNTFNQTQIIGITDTNVPNRIHKYVNVIHPLDYNNNQPSIFTVTNFIYSVVITDSKNVLKNGKPIYWIINDKMVSINEKNDIKEETRCSNKYKESCSTSITSFCEDNSYCNGIEICYPSLIDPLIGSCMQTTEIIDCNNVNMVCNDTIRGCIPKNHIETVTPSVYISNELGCYTNSDCIDFNSFCEGSFICDKDTSSCRQFDNSYDPCSSYRDTLDEFYNQSNSTSFPINITCVEESQLCIESFTCTKDLDCSDNLKCNGIEQCIEGRCYFQKNQDISFICNSSSPNMKCTEKDGCFILSSNIKSQSEEHHHHSPHAPHSSHAPTHHHHDDDDDDDDDHHHNGISTSSLIIAIIVIVLIVIGLVVLVIILYFEFSEGNDSYIASMTQGDTIGLSSRSSSSSQKDSYFNKKYNSKKYND